jgi:hypothetical protein
MAGQVFEVWNGASVAAAAPVAVTTGTVVKTMLQLENATNNMRVIEWGVSFNIIPTAVVQAELIVTTVAATVTAYVANDITAFSDPASGYTGAGLAITTTTSGYTATAEGTVVAPVRQGDFQQLWTNQYLKQFPLGREFEVQRGTYLRVRLTTATAINAVCYVVFEV